MTIADESHELLSRLVENCGWEDFVHEFGTLIGAGLPAEEEIDFLAASSESCRTGYFPMKDRPEW